VLVGPHPAPEERGASEGTVREELERAMAEQGLNERAALKVVARRRGLSRSAAYRQWQFDKSLES
jgi:hypothetical protein